MLSKSVRSPFFFIIFFFPLKSDEVIKRSEKIPLGRMGYWSGAGLYGISTVDIVSWYCVIIHIQKSVCERDKQAVADTTDGRQSALGSRLGCLEDHVHDSTCLRDDACFRR